MVFLHLRQVGIAVFGTLETKSATLALVRSMVINCASIPAGVDRQKLMCTEVRVSLLYMAVSSFGVAEPQGVVTVRALCIRLPVGGRSPGRAGERSRGSAPGPDQGALVSLQRDIALDRPLILALYRDIKILRHVFGEYYIW